MNTGTGHEITDPQFEAASDMCLSVMAALLKTARGLDKRAETATGEEKDALLKQLAKTNRRTRLYLKEAQRVKNGSMTAYNRTYKYHLKLLQQIDRGTIRRPFKYDHPQPV